MRVIMVQMSSYAWTLAAVHQASGLARRTGGGVKLLQLIPVSPAWLGINGGWYTETLPVWKALNEYEATAEDYSVEFAIQPMQYVSFHDAVVQAADYLNADIAFVHLQAGNFAWWNGIRVRNLERRLEAVHCQLQTDFSYWWESASRYGSFTDRKSG